MTDEQKKRKAASQKKWQQNNQHRWQGYQLKKKYGMTLEQFDALLAAQGGRCAICQTDDPGSRGRFFVDHCHATNAVRGLLCHPCNSALGLFKDNTASLAKAIEYLKCSEMRA